MIFQVPRFCLLVTYLRFVASLSMRDWPVIFHYYCVLINFISSVSDKEIVEEREWLYTASGSVTTLKIYLVISSYSDHIHNLWSHNSKDPSNSNASMYIRRQARSLHYLRAHKWKNTDVR